MKWVFRMIWHMISPPGWEVRVFLKLWLQQDWLSDVTPARKELTFYLVAQDLHRLCQKLWEKNPKFAITWARNVKIIKIWREWGMEFFWETMGQHFCSLADMRIKVRMSHCTAKCDSCEPPHPQASSGLWKQELHHLEGFYYAPSVLWSQE